MSRVRRLLPLALLLLLLLGGAGGIALVLLRPGVTADDDRADVGSAGGSRSGDPSRSRRERVHLAATGEGGGTAGVPQEGPADGAATEPAGASHALPGDVGAPETVAGRVCDGDTGSVIASARIRCVRGAGRWVGTHAGEDGSFEVEIPADDGSGAPVELRIARKGYRTLVVPWAGGPVEARLVPEDRPPAAGTIEGFATSSAGRALSGRLLLTTYDEAGDHHGLWALADATGAFVLEGLAPGWWQIALVDGGELVDVVVPEGGTTRAHVVAGPAPWPGELSEEEFTARHAALSGGIPPGVTDERLDGRKVDVRAVSDLENRWRAVRPAREVIVTGLPRDGAAHLRAATMQGPNASWRVRVVDGVARFPALTPEAWRLVLEVPGAADVALRLAVEPGAGALQVDWGAAR